MRSLIFIATSFIVMASSARASVIQYTNKAAWEAAVPSHSTIDFVGPLHGIPINTQYYDAYGITFAPSNWAWNDGEFFGLLAQPGSRFYFDTPRHAVAVTFIGSVVFNLYY